MRAASALPGLAECSCQESITIAIAVDYPIKKALWLQALVILLSLPMSPLGSLPLNMKQPVTSLTPFVCGDIWVFNLMKELAWEEVGKALEHCQSLNVLKIAARNSDKLIPFTEEQDARGAILYFYDQTG